MALTPHLGLLPGTWAPCWPPWPPQLWCPPWTWTAWEWHPSWTVCLRSPLLSWSTDHDHVSADNTVVTHTQVHALVTNRNGGPPALPRPLLQLLSGGMVILIRILLASLLWRERPVGLYFRDIWFQNKESQFSEIRKYQNYTSLQESEAWGKAISLAVFSFTKGWGKVFLIFRERHYWMNRESNSELYTSFGPLAFKAVLRRLQRSVTLLLL